jgi:hypothetical protein
MELKNYYISKEIYSKNGNDIIYGYKIKNFYILKEVNTKKLILSRMKPLVGFYF